MRQYRFYQGLNFKQCLTLESRQKKRKVFQVDNSYLPDFPQDSTAASYTKSVFCRNLSQVDLSAETRAQTQTLDTQYEYLHTHTHQEKNYTHTHTEHSEGTTAFNPFCAAISPKCDSSPLF